MRRHKDVFEERAAPLSPTPVKQLPAPTHPYTVMAPVDLERGLKRKKAKEKAGSITGTGLSIWRP